MIQSTFYKRDRNEKYLQQVREAYAEWAGALLHEIQAIRNVLGFREELRANPTAQAPEGIRLHFLGGMRDFARTAMDATQNEQVAFCRVLLTDQSRDRVNRAHGIRTPVKQFQPGDDRELDSLIEEYGRIENNCTGQLSGFLSALSIELGTGHSSGSTSSRGNEVNSDPE